MNTSVRIFLITILGLTITAIIYAPRMAWLSVIICMAALIAGFKIFMKTTIDPHRPIVYRFGHMHHIGQPGAIFIIPGIENIFPNQCVNMQLRTQKIKLNNMRPSDSNERFYAELQIRWRISPEITLIDTMIKMTLLMDMRQSEKTPDTTIDELGQMVDQTINVAAKHLALHYPKQAFERIDTREDFIQVLRDSVNEIFKPYGLILETVYWVDFDSNSDKLAAQVEIAISHERVSGLIKDIQEIREKLPDLPPEDVIALQAYLDLLRRGLPPPSPQFMQQIIQKQKPNPAAKT